MNILVPAGAGFIGSHLVRALVSGGEAELVDGSGSASARDTFDRAQGELTRRGLA